MLPTSWLKTTRSTNPVTPTGCLLIKKLFLKKMKRKRNNKEWSTTGTTIIITINRNAASKWKDLGQQELLAARRIAKTMNLQWCHRNDIAPRIGYAAQISSRIAFFSAVRPHSRMIFLAKIPYGMRLRPHSCTAAAWAVRPPHRRTATSLYHQMSDCDDQSHFSTISKF